MANCALHGKGNESAESAERPIRHHFAKIGEEFQILRAVLIGNDLIDYLDAARGTDAARRALAATFDGAKFHREAGLMREIDRIVEDDHAAVAEHALLFSEGFVIERRIEKRFRKIGAERPAHLHGAQRTSASSAAAVIVDCFAKAEAEGFFHQATVLDVSRELDGQRSARFAHAEIAIVLRRPYPK